jgi:transposase
MFKRHKQTIANALSNPDSNAYAERMNGSIQELKFVARGFRNIHNFRIVILFHHGKLNLFPTLNFL